MIPVPVYLACVVIQTEYYLHVFIFLSKKLSRDQFQFVVMKTLRPIQTHEQCYPNKNIYIYIYIYIYI